MKTLILLLFGVTLSLANEEESTADPIAQDVARDAATLREILSDNWTIRAKGNEITLTSMFDVFIVSLVARGGPMPPKFTDKTPRKLLLKETQPTKYLIRLRYEKPMLHDEYARRREERQKMLLGSGVAGKNEATEWRVKFEKLKMPRYRGEYDIYEELPYYGQGNLTYPPKALQKVGGAKEILAAVLHQEVTDID